MWNECLLQTANGKTHIKIHKKFYKKAKILSYLNQGHSLPSHLPPIQTQHSTSDCNHFLFPWLVVRGLSSWEEQYAIMSHPDPSCVLMRLNPRLVWLRSESSLLPLSSHLPDWGCTLGAMVWEDCGPDHLVLSLAHESVVPLQANAPFQMFKS